MAHLNYIPNKVRETLDEGKHEYHFTSACVSCKTEKQMTVEGMALHKWHNNEGHVQDLFPNLTASEREQLFQSGLCDDCWSRLWASEDDEEG